jgi:hypothetical protein
MTGIRMCFLLHWIAKALLMEPLLTMDTIALPIHERVVNLLARARYGVILENFLRYIDYDEHAGTYR